MFLEELELVGYERMNLNQFKRIKLNFNKIVQVIIGTNGSGKSSLFAEMSPLPAEPKNFTKDGMKRVVCRHEGKRYILTSTFDPPRHSFMVEGELDDLNPGGTITEQRRLVYKHFKINAATHAIATGQSPFHLMGTETRKECFRLLADTNFDYAIGVFNRVKTMARDVTGALKLAKVKLVDQSAKMMPSETLDALKKDCEELYRIVEMFIEHRNTPTAPIHETKNAISNALDEMDNDSSALARSIREVERLLATGIVEDPKNASNLEYFVNQKLQDMRVRKESLFTESKRYQENIEICERTKLFQVATISTELERLKTERERLQGSLIYQHEIFDPTAYIAELDAVTPRLLELASAIPINEKSEKYTRDGFKAMMAQREKLLIAIANLKAENRNWEERVAHHDDHKDSPEVTCPKCDHTWQPFYNEAAIEQIKAKINKANLEIEFKQKLVDDLDVKIADFNNWVAHLDAMKALAAEHGLIRELWALVMKREVVYEKPRDIGLIITKFKSDLYNLQTIQKIDEQTAEEHDKLRMANDSQGIDYNNSVTSLQFINNELHHIANEETRLNSIKDSARSLATHTKRITDLTVKLKDSEKDLVALTERHVEDIRRVMYNDLLRSFSSDLAIKEKAINDERINEGAIKALEAEIKLLESRSEAYKLVLKELSPTEGMIAEGLFGYMKLFVRKWNRFIASVWTYPLIVQPCSSEEGKLELNYKFPIMVNDSRGIRDDVAKGSSSMREIIDLGFVVGYLKTMGLENSQLFLDEFGSAMDPIHKQQTVRMINSIVENEKFSQIFLISHDVAQYSAMDNAEVCILHEANTIIPPGCVYNKHVVFE
jgi:ABC-type dipeptide/oligopeptide/nickel transport system ATPase component